MMIATTMWLIDRTTLVAVVPSLMMGRTKEAMRPINVSATDDDRGRLAHRRHAAAPATAPAHQAPRTRTCERHLGTISSALARHLIATTGEHNVSAEAFTTNSFPGLADLTGARSGCGTGRRGSGPG
ncbi:hypothetical protein E1264_13130 [Actinomadura sp. KC216]|uniref:hypothetical protein n=1 Tax=Actinomadura sp. KC216 TaxID=2530370 RepID=UPI00104E4FF4|nr:hypothetical protein [Actinomadura sp. KC216]TDB87902.1 hypothetical protein E1264_13130 [Actinomadura sp. KC216]